MGEMVLLLVYELNQLLVVINNYCMGVVGCFKFGCSMLEELILVLEKIFVQVVCVGMIIQCICGFVKCSQLQWCEFDLCDIVVDVVGLVELEVIWCGIIIFMCLLGDLLYLYVDLVLIEQVFVNLFKNVVEVMVVYLCLCVVSVLCLYVNLINDFENFVLIEVIDQGLGVDDSIKEWLFELFFSIKFDGMGMGLNICCFIIEFYFGRFWVENNVDGIGCMFKIILLLNLLQIVFKIQNVD